MDFGDLNFNLNSRYLEVVGRARYRNEVEAFAKRLVEVAQMLPVEPEPPQ